jgi:hypothetical protein
MDAIDAAEAIREAVAEEAASHAEDDQFRNRAALVIAILAALLAISSLGGDNAGEDMVTANIRASDTWAFFQAKNLRQTANELAAAQIDATLLTGGASLSPEERARLEESAATFRATAARYEDEPDPAAPGDSLRGDGKKQLSAQARSWEGQRDRASSQDTNFDYAAVLFQIAIVLGSVAILATSRRTLLFAIALGVAGTALTVNGFLLIVPL